MVTTTGHQLLNHGEEGGHGWAGPVKPVPSVPSNRFTGVLHHIIGMCFRRINVPLISDSGQTFSWKLTLQRQILTDTLWLRPLTLTPEAPDSGTILPPNKPIHPVSPLPRPPASLLYPSTVNPRPQPWIQQAGHSVFHLRQQKQLVSLTIGLRASTTLSKLIFFPPFPCDHKTLVHWPVPEEVRQRGDAAGHLSIMVTHLCPDCPVRPVCVSRSVALCLCCGSPPHKDCCCLFFLYICRLNFHTKESPQRLKIQQSQQQSQQNYQWAWWTAIRHKCVGVICTWISDQCLSSVPVRRTLCWHQAADHLSVEQLL